MSLVKLPRTRYYWHGDLQMTSVSDYMSSRKWEIIKSNIHFVDNEKALDKWDPNYDKIFKVRPLVERINTKFNRIPLTENLCIDEQMVPYSGTRGPRY